MRLYIILGYQSDETYIYGLFVSKDEALAFLDALIRKHRCDHVTQLQDVSRFVDTIIVGQKNVRLISWFTPRHGDDANTHGKCNGEQLSDILDLYEIETSDSYPPDPLRLAVDDAIERGIKPGTFIAAAMAAGVEASKRMRLQAGSSPWDAFLKKAAEMQELDTECSADGGYGA